MEKVKVTTANGLTFEASEEILRHILSGTGLTLDLNHYYNSSTRGMIPIKNMETTHLKNAVFKMLHEDLDKVKTQSILEISNFLSGKFSTQNPVLAKMIKELHLR